MKYWLFFLAILVTSPVFAACKIDQQQFGVSSQTIKSKLEFSTTFEPIPGFQKEVLTIFEEVCPSLEKTLARDTTLTYHFIQDQLIMIELVRTSSNDLLLFEWGRENFNIQEKWKINEEQQFIQVEQSDHIIQLLVRVLPDTVFQNIALVSTQHNDLFELLYEKEESMDWDTLEDLDNEFDISEEN
jgi:hypothetical protein